MPLHENDARCGADMQRQVCAVCVCLWDVGCVHGVRGDVVCCVCGMSGCVHDVRGDLRGVWWGFAWSVVGYPRRGLSFV